MSSRVYRLMDEAAARLASRLADWSVRNASATQREWLVAIRSELASIEPGSAQLKWAVGGAWMVASQVVQRRPGSHGGSREGGAMRTADASWLGAVGRNAVSMLLFWCSLAVSQKLETASGGWEQSSRLIIFACVAGLAGAVSLRAVLTAYMLAGQVAFGIAELVFHTGISIQVVQGASAHFSVMIAATLAAVLAGAVSKTSADATTTRAAAPAGFLASQRVVFAALHARWPLLSSLFVVALAWAVPELLARALVGDTPYRDGLTDWAIALAALIGYGVGSITARLLGTPQPAATEVVCASTD